MKLKQIDDLCSTIMSVCFAAFTVAATVYVIYWVWSELT